MIKHSAAYDQAVVDDSRRQYVRATFDLVDPDAEVAVSGTSGDSAASLPHQLPNRGMGEGPTSMASLEPCRWLLDGSFQLLPRTQEQEAEQHGWESEGLSGEDRAFGEPYPYIELTIENVEILQAVSLEFSGKEFNGVPEDFTVDIYSGDNLLTTFPVTGNGASSVVLDGFTANYPTRIRMTLSKWSLPWRRARVVRLLIGLFEEWDTRVIKSVDIYSEVTFSGLKIPYSTCGIEVYNENHRFDPYAPNAIFQSIEDRQAIKVELGLRLADGSIEWIPGGTYFQQSAGWKLNDLTVEWSLLDIIGALVKRRFVLPDTMPTTTNGWLQAIMGSLGTNFINNYIVDEEIGAIPITATADAVQGKNCGELLRFLCMATNTWPHQDFETGYLKLDFLPHREDGRITLDNMTKYPTMSANGDIADITFKLDDGEVTFPGNNTDSEVSLTVSNPFVHTTADALAAAVSCLFEYGGKTFQVASRGNASTECGDILSVDTQFLSTITARLYKQQLKMENGILRNVPSYLVQSPNDTYYANGVLLEGDGEWTAPTTGTVKVVLVGGGTGGQGGGGGRTLENDGWDPDPADGDIGGAGGRIIIVNLAVTEGDVYAYSCGLGGAGGSGGEGSRGGRPGELGAEGGDTVFGDLTTAAGRSYVLGYMSVTSGAAYGQKGGDNGYPARGKNGTGGTGGRHGEDGLYKTKTRKNPDGSTYEYKYVAARPTAGTDGTAGLDGCVYLEW